MRGEVRGREMMRGRRGIVIVGMVIGLLLGCNNGLAELEKRNSFYESVVKIGQGFQEVFGIFGNAMGEALGFNAVKSGDKRDKVGAHFKKIGEGLKSIKNNLNELPSKISEAKNADGNTVKVVEGAIRGASDVFDKFIDALTKLAGVTSDSSTDIGDTANNATSEPAEEASVKTIIAEVKNIIDAAEKSGLKITAGTAGGQVTNANGAKALIHNSGADANVGPKLGDEVSKADPWAIIDKIKNAKTSTSAPAANNEHEAGALATGVATSNGAGAKTNADLAAAVALKAMIKGGKLSAATNEVVGVKAAGVSAVNKVLGILDLIIRKTVNSHLEKVREAVKGIQYSETTGTNATEANTSTK